MDISTLIFWAIIFVVMAAVMYSGYQMGKKTQEGTTAPSVFKKLLSVSQKKDAVLHERDPWDEQRIDRPDRPKIEQTVEAEERNG